jgi:hypothetical protein
MTSLFPIEDIGYSMTVFDCETSLVPDLKNDRVRRRFFSRYGVFRDYHRQIMYKQW